MHTNATDTLHTAPMTSGLKKINPNCVPDVLEAQSTCNTHSTTRYIVRSLTLVFAMLTLASPANAQTGILTTITTIRTGWNSDSFAVVTADPISNPAYCPTVDGYITDNSQPGYSTYYQAALTAYVGHKKVVITVDNSQCLGGRPKLIGINLTNQ